MPTPVLGEIIINNNFCDGCGVCINKCPNNVLELKDISDKDYKGLTVWGKLKVKLKGKQKSFVENIEACIQCGLCEDNCHEAAIVIGKN